jgi:chromosome partitioning protein
MITVVGNLKGGSGKSTVTFNLVLWLMRQGKTVHTYDFDLQRTLLDVVQVRKEEGHKPVLKAYHRYNPIQQQVKPTNEILIDIGAANMTGMKRAFSLADRVVIPVGPSQADIWSTQRFLYLIASEVKEKPPEVLAFINRADTHVGIRESDEAEAALSILPGVKVLKARLCQRTTYRRSFSEGLAVFELQPSGKASKEFNALACLLYPK